MPYLPDRLEFICEILKYQISQQFLAWSIIIKYSIEDSIIIVMNNMYLYYWSWCTCIESATGSDHVFVVVIGYGNETIWEIKKLHFSMTIEIHVYMSWKQPNQRTSCTETFIMYIHCHGGPTPVHYRKGVEHHEFLQINFTNPSDFKLLKFYHILSFSLRKESKQKLEYTRLVHEPNQILVPSERANSTSDFFQLHYMYIKKILVGMSR